MNLTAGSFRQYRTRTTMVVTDSDLPAVDGKVNKYSDVETVVHKDCSNLAAKLFVLPTEQFKQLMNKTPSNLDLIKLHINSRKLFYNLQGKVAFYLVGSSSDTHPSPEVVA